MTPEEEIGKAEAARQVLEADIFRESVKAVEDALIGGIKRAAIKDAELREKLCLQLVALEAVVGQLKSHMETGKLAEETIKRRRGASR